MVASVLRIGRTDVNHMDMSSPEREWGQPVWGERLNLPAANGTRKPGRSLELGQGELDKDKWFPLLPRTLESQLLRSGQRIICDPVGPAL